MIALNIKNFFNKTIDFFYSSPELMITSYIVLPLFVIFLCSKVLINVEINTLWQMLIITIYIIYGIINSQKNTSYLITKINNNEEKNILLKSLIVYAITFLILFLIKGKDVQLISNIKYIYTFMNVYIYLYLINILYDHNLMGDKRDIIILKVLSLSTIAILRIDNIFYIILLLIFIVILYRIKYIKNYMLYSPYNISIGLIIALILVFTIFHQYLKLPQNLLIILIYLVVNTYPLEAFNKVQVKSNEYYKKINILYLNYIVGLLTALIISISYEYEIIITVTIYTFLYNISLITANYLKLENTYYSLVNAIPCLILIFIPSMSIHIIITMNIISIILFLIIIDLEFKLLIREFTKSLLISILIYTTLQILNLEIFIIPMIVLILSGHIHELIHAITFKMTGNYTYYKIRFGVFKNVFVCTEKIKFKRVVYIMPSIVLTIIGIILNIFNQPIGWLLIIQVFNLMPVEGLDGYNIIRKEKNEIKKYN